MRAYEKRIVVLTDLRVDRKLCSYLQICLKEKIEFAVRKLLREKSLLYKRTLLESKVL